MKTNNIYLNRLLKLAYTLRMMEQSNPSKKYRATENETAITHFNWALGLIPDIVNSDTSLNTRSISGLRECETLYKAAIYYSLTADEMYHLFVPGYQEEFFGGRCLSNTATPWQLSENILEFVKIKDEEQQGPVSDWKANKREKQQNKLLTFKTITYEDTYYADAHYLS